MSQSGSSSQSRNSSSGNVSSKTSGHSSGNSSTRAFVNVCGRMYVIVLGAAAITCSVLAVFSCQFFQYRTLDGQPWNGFDAPFDELTKASVGPFSYSEMQGEDDSLKSLFFGDQCVTYDDWTEAGHNKLFYVAQWCSMFAPVAGFLAWFQIVMEMMCCRLRGSFISIGFLYFAACILQGCTFLMFGDKEFCFQPQSQNQCALQNGAWYTIGSAAAYLILAILTTALPVYPKTGGKCMFICTRSSKNKNKNANAVSVDGKRAGSDTSWQDVSDEERPQSRGEEISTDWDGDVSDEEQPQSRGEEISTNWGVVAEDDEQYYKDNSSSLLSNSSALMSSVNLNSSGDEIEELDVLSNDATTQAASNTDTCNDEAASQRKNNGIVLLEVEGSQRSSRGGGQDFFDVACCGDPLQLEKYLTDKKGRKKGKGSRRSSAAEIDPTLGAVL